jgi:heat shock protein HslJ
MLTGATWQWVSFTDPVQQFEVGNPENYTLTFQPDGTLQIKADCNNNASATYTATEEGAFSVEPGIATLALCPGDSRSEAFVQNLGFGAGYFSRVEQ